MKKRTTIEIGNTRLLKLAAFLRKVRPTRFDMDVWVGSDWKGATNLSCGTAACALGWATTMPTFRKLGLRLKPGDGSGGISSIPIMGYGERTIYGFAAASRLFKLSMMNATDLFGGDEGMNRRTPKQVAAAIEAFVALRRKGARG